MNSKDEERFSRRLIIQTEVLKVLTEADIKKSFEK